MKTAYTLKALASAALLLGATACTEDVMDRINANMANPDVDIVAPKFQITDAIMASGFTTSSGDYSFYVASLVEQELGTGNNQLAHAELRNASEWTASSTFNNVWNGTYSNLSNLKDIEAKCQEGGVGEGQLDILGMAQVLEVFNWAILTDMHGDIPYSEACQGSDVLQPKLDSQSEIYPSLLATLDEAIQNLEDGAAMGNAGAQDLLYGGDCQAWSAFAYALKARLMLHMTHVDSSYFSQALAAAQQAVDLGFEPAQITNFNGIDCDNPWSAYNWSRGYANSSNTVVDLMLATDDPRIYAYTWFECEGFDPGDEETANQSWAEVYPIWLDLGDQPVTLLGEAELNFIIAECQARLGHDCTSAFQTAVKASVTEQCTYGDALAATGWNAADFATSLGTPDLEMVMQQKYLSQVVDGQIEAWNDYRRCEAMGETWIALTNPCNTQSGINRFPYVLPYGNSSVISNPKVAAAYGDGYYIYSTKCWLFQ